MADLGPPFLTRLEKLSPKMMLTARYIAEIMTFQSKYLIFFEIAIFPIVLLLVSHFLIIWGLGDLSMVWAL